MKKGIKAILLILIILAIVLTCMQVCFLVLKYRIIGKTAPAIIEKYGDFDCVRMQPEADEAYENVTCSYYLTKEHVGYLGTTSPCMLSIQFDENGVAWNIFFEAGGIGG